MTTMINKSQITKVKIYDSELKEGYEYLPERIVYLPFTKCKIIHERAGWTKGGRNSMFGWISEDDMDDMYVVKDGKLYLKPRVKIQMSSGWRDDFYKYFDTVRKCTKWCEDKLDGIKLIRV